MKKLTSKKILINLPHSHGFTHSSWTVQDKGKHYRCDTKYRCHNPDNYQDFDDIPLSVIIPKDAPYEFRIHFHGRRSQYLARKYELRPWIEYLLLDTIKQLEM